mmetsp:Transcript_3402/g.9762  ORF Transcript_3402/g.9762 Transcript_3402/m.9762 type:complete len:215 (-) Transcript_3402:1776-2420(-)
MRCMEHCLSEGIHRCCQGVLLLEWTSVGASQKARLDRSFRLVYSIALDLTFRALGSSRSSSCDENEFSTLCTQPYDWVSLLAASAICPADSCTLSRSSSCDEKDLSTACTHPSAWAPPIVMSPFLSACLKKSYLSTSADEGRGAVLPETAALDLSITRSRRRARASSHPAPPLASSTAVSRPGSCCLCRGHVDGSEMRVATNLGACAGAEGWGQ